MSNYKVTYSFDHMVTWLLVTNELRYILHPRIIKNYNKLKKIKNLIVILLKFVFFDIIKGCWMKFMAINGVIDLEDPLFLKKKQR